MSRFIQPDVDPTTLTDRELDALIDYVRQAAVEIDDYLINLAGVRAKRTLDRIEAA